MTASDTGSGQTISASNRERAKARILAGDQPNTSNAARIAGASGLVSGSSTGSPTRLRAISVAQLEQTMPSA